MIQKIKEHLIIVYHSLIFDELHIYEDLENIRLNGFGKSFIAEKTNLYYQITRFKLTVFETIFPWVKKYVPKQ